MKLSGKDIAFIAAFGIGAFLAWKLYQGIKFNLDQALPWWKNFFGTLPPGTQITDTTGQGGQVAEQKAFNKVVNNHSQGFYNSAMQQTAYDDGLQTSLEIQGTDSWPWTSYDNWKSKGYPTLPNSDAVTVDDNGVYHNDYF